MNKHQGIGEKTMAKKSVFTNIDCIQLYVPNLQKEIEYYCDALGLNIIWKTDSSV
jgi:catechol-2,3-dioxygenase